MRNVEIRIAQYLPGSSQADAESLTVASLEFTADGVPLLELEDTLARCVRTHVNVSAYALARWLAVNWWRLRWEARPRVPSPEWQHAHCLAAIGGGFAWPPVEISSDGSYVQIETRAEAVPDVAGIRYLSARSVDVPCAAFEQAVERFWDSVESRLAAVLPGAHEELGSLRQELQGERSDPHLARQCKLQAVAGFDVGDVPEGWLQEAEHLSTIVGGEAGVEVLAVVQDLPDGIAGAHRAIDAMHNSPITVKLDWLAADPAPALPGELPWQTGARLASELRKRLCIPPGPIGNTRLAELLGVRLPVEPAPISTRCLLGGYRNGSSGRSASVLVAARRPDSQRFYLARLMAAAMLAVPGQHVLPVTVAGTALQKATRTFAQEFLCPWEEIELLTAEKGLGEEAISEIAERFEVSEWVIISALVNRGRLPQERHPLFV